MKCPCCQSSESKIQEYSRSHNICTNCGLIFIKRHSPRSAIIKYFEQIDPKGEVSESKQAFFDYALRRLDTQRGTSNSLLDIGCGIGDFLRKAQKRGWQPYGVEISKELSDVAARRLCGVRVFNGSVEEAAFKENTFSVITIWDTLFHMERPYRDLEECYRILKDNGTIGIRIRNAFFQKNIDSLYLRFGKIAEKLNLKKPSVFHEFCFSKKAIKLMLKRVGFRQVTILNSPLSAGDPYNHSQWALLIKAVKVTIYMVSQVIFTFSSGRWTIGPSLLIWAKK